MSFHVSVTRYFIIFVLFMIARNVTEIWIKPGKKEDYDIRDRFTLLVFLLSYLISATAICVLLLTESRTNYIAFFSGLTTVALGFWGRVVALKKISTNYRQSMAPGENAILVTDGIYGVLRHPLYTFYALEMLGLFLVRFNWISFSMLAINLLNTAYRIKYEERLLKQRYGEQYGEHLRKMVI
jgi:protein-S-isoprenylcysteine O-methyltransferase Ste14